MGQGQIGTLKRSLEQTHQIQMGDPDGISGLFKQ
jgi:hypothetical protein